jgi:hypothetical protein
VHRQPVLRGRKNLAGAARPAASPRLLSRSGKPVAIRHTGDLRFVTIRRKQLIEDRKSPRFGPARAPPFDNVTCH